MSRYQDPKKPECSQHQIIADILRKYGLAANTALVEELCSAVNPTEVDPNEPYVNSIDMNDFLETSLMCHIIDDIYYHASLRGWERCIIRVEREVANEQTAEKETQET